MLNEPLSVEPTAADSTGNCLYCRYPVPESESVELRSRTTSEVRVAHHKCRAAHLAQEKRDGEWHARVRRERLISSWNFSISNPLTTFPAWEFARSENAEFMRRVSKPVADGITNWSGDSSLFVSAPTGAGKTALVVAALHRRFAQQVARLESGPLPSLVVDFAFVSGPQIAGCRRRAKIGIEAELVELAIETPLLILDELGYEPVSEELLFVVDARHKFGRPTVTTTGRTVEGFVERYGGSLFRKLTENGTTVEGWKK